MHRADLDVLWKIDNKDNFLLNYVLLAIVLLYDKHTVMVPAFSTVEFM